MARQMAAATVQPLAEAVVAATGRGIRDEAYASKTSTKPRIFDGRDDTWPVWSWRFEASMAQLGLETEFATAAGKDPKDLLLGNYSEATKNVIKVSLELAMFKIAAFVDEHPAVVTWTWSGHELQCASDACGLGHGQAVLLNAPLTLAVLDMANP